MTDNEKNDEFIENIESNQNIIARKKMMDDLEEMKENDSIKKEEKKEEEPIENFQASDNTESFDILSGLENSLGDDDKKDNVVGVVETSPKKETQKKRSKKTVDVVSPVTAEKIKEKKAGNENLPKVKNSIDEFDDIDERVDVSNREAYERSNINIEDAPEDLTVEKLNKTIEEIYSSDESAYIDDGEKVKVEVINEPVEEKPNKQRKKKSKTNTESSITFYGGDGKTSSFKTKVSKNAKILRNINIEDTSKISSVAIEAKTAQDRQKIYLETVLPTLQPTIVVVPMIISGVVISMSAFSWPDIKEICLIEEKLDDLDQNDPDYIYEKNKNFIEKRKKQLQLFYKHITAISGYETKPSFDELFNKILKFPDFQQLFFAAYATTSQSKDHQFNLACGACGSDNYVVAKPKDLCFLLNKNININKLIYYIEKGSTLDSSESGKIYREFQEEKIVEMANTTYRTKKPLPNSAFIYDLKIPTIGDALNAMSDIIETFRDKDLSYTDEYTGSTVYIDSSFGLSSDLIELRYYLYIHKLIVADIIDEDKESNSAKVTYVDFDDKTAIYNSIFSLSPQDYKALITDETLQKLARVTGIRHAIKGGICKEPTCKSDLGNVSVEPETLFFMIAQQELVY